MKTYEQIQKLYNVHNRELDRMVELCNDDLQLTELVYFYCKMKYYGFWLPSNNEELQSLISETENITIRDKQTNQLGRINTSYGFLDLEKYYYPCVWDSGTSNQYLIPFWRARHTFTLI